MKTVLPLNGRINTDVNPLYLDSQKGEVLSRRNMRVFSADGGKTGINVSIKGMGEYTFSDIVDDEYSAIGSVYDQERERGIVAFYGGSDRHCIGVVKKDGTTFFLSKNKSFWDFSLSNNVDMAVLGDTLLMTDNHNPPRKVALKNSSGSVIESEITSLSNLNTQLAVDNPSDAPTIFVGSDSTKKVNKLIGKTFQFATYLVYTDYTYSVLSPYSDLAISPTLFDTGDNTYTDNALGNYVSVTYSLVGNNLKSVVLVAREGNTGSWFKVDSYDVQSGDTTRTVTFYNDVARQYLSVQDALSLYSDVPVYAKNLLAVQNRVCMANVTKGYDPVDLNYTLDVVYESVDVTGSSSVLSHALGVASPEAGDLFFEWEIPSSLTPGTVINVGISQKYSQSWADGKIFEFNINYSFSRVVEVGDTQASVIALINADILSKVNDIASDTPFANTRVGIDYTVFPLVTPPTLQVGFGIGDVYSSSGTYSGGSAGSYLLTGNRGGGYSIDTPPAGVSTFKAGSYYNVGGSFYDSKSRTNGVLTPQQVYIPFNGERDYADINKKARISFEFTGQDVPSWATSFRFAVTESVNFAGVYPFVTGSDGIDAHEITIDNKKAIAIRMPENFNYEFLNGDFLLLEVDSGTAITTITKNIIGTRSSITVSGTDEAGFWLIIPEGTQAISDYTGKVATIYRAKDAVEDLVYYEDYNTYDPTDAGFSSLSGYIDCGDAWFVNRKFQYDDGGSGAEVIKVVEDFYVNTDLAIRSYAKGRATAELESLGQINLQDFVWSNPYLDNTKINGISTFISSNRVQLDEKDGSITRTMLVGDVVKVIQSHKETSLYVGKEQVTNADGSLTLVKTGSFIGTVYPSTEDYGSRVFTAFAKNNRNLYYWDGDRGQVIRSSPNGQIAISDNGNASYFTQKKSELDAASTYKVLLHYDVKNDELMVLFDVNSGLNGNSTEAFIYKEGANEWTRFLDYYKTLGSIKATPETFFNIGNQVWSMFRGRAMKHEATTNYNTFYGQYHDSSVQVVVNTYPTEEKCLRALKTDSNRAADTVVESPVAETRPVGQKSILYAESYRGREGDYTSAVYGNILKADSSEDISLLHTGSDMVGKYLTVEFTDDGTSEFQLRLLTAGFTVNR